MIYIFISVFLVSFGIQSNQKKLPREIELMGKISQKEIDQAEYILGPGDVLEISLLGSLNYTFDAEVDLEGNVGLEQAPLSLPGQTPTLKAERQPTVSLVKVAGLSLKEAIDRIKEAYNTLYPKVPIRVRLVLSRTFYLPILGAVKKPGLTMVTGIERLSQALADAGGLQPGAALTRIEMYTSKGGMKKVNLYKFITDGSESDNPYVAQSVKIVVPFTDNFVRVKGAIVENPFSPKEEKPTQKGIGFVPKSYSVNETVVEYEEGDSVGSVIMKAGGIQDLADTKNIKVLRKGKWIKTTYSTLIEPGDLVYVPFLENEVYVEGAVTTPGAFPFIPGKTVGDYIAIAGGPLERAKGKVYLMISNGKKTRVSFDRIVSRGDRIYVPWTTFKWWEDYLKIASVLTTVVVTWLTISKR